MIEATWVELLSELEQATNERRVRWQPSDRPGSYVLAQSSGSVVVRGAVTDPTELALEQLAGGSVGLRGPEVHVMDTNGEVVAELVPVTLERVGMIPPADKETMLYHEGAHVGFLLDRLVRAILAERRRGEEVVLDILDELRGGS